MKTNTKLNMDNIMDKYIHELIILNPTLNDYIGFPQYRELKKHWENNLSNDYLKLEKNLYQKYLKLMQDKQKLDKKQNNKISNTIDIWEKCFIYDLTISLELIDSPMIYMPMNHLENPILSYIELSLGDSLYCFENKEDYDWFLHKTTEFEIWCNTAIEKMKEGITKKYVLPKISVTRMIKQLKDSLNSKDHMKHKIKYKLDYDFLDALDNLLTRIINNLLFFLENIYLKHASTDIGFSKYPNGKKYYKLFVKSETGLDDLTIAKIHKMGINEVNRIYKEIHHVMDILKFKGDCLL